MSWSPHVVVASIVERDDVMARTHFTARRVGTAFGEGGSQVGVTLEALLTGAIHLDALADTADGLGAGTKERALEIMRDPAGTRLLQE